MAFVYPTSFAIEMELGGVGLGWTNVSADVRANVPIRWKYGIDGNGLTDRVASPGSLTFALNNSTLNSGHLLGYYSLGHVNCRSGFTTGINVRLKIVFAATTYVKFHGRLSSVIPAAGQYGSRVSLCVVHDWMDEASRAKLKRVPLQTNKRADEVTTTIVAAMSRQPVSQTFGTGRDTYVFALDSSPEEGLGVLNEFQRIAQSEVGYIYVRGNTGSGGELVFESRTDRAGKNVNVATFDNTMYALDVASDRDDVVTRLQVVQHPKRKDLANIVLFTLRDSSVSIDTAISLGSGEVKTLIAEFSDPNNRGQRIGATSVVTPLVATTDYLFNAAADGSGTNLTASLIVTSTILGASAAAITFQNTNAAAGFVTFLQIRGLGIYDLVDVIWEQESTSVATAKGENTLTYDMPYQSDPDVCDGAARYFLALFQTQVSNVAGISILGNVSSTLMTHALAREPGERIGLAEAATGLTTTGGYFIQSCEGEISKGLILKMRWGLAPASQQVFWLLGTAGVSELGSTTILGF
jgi:hypothetical protein